MTAAGAPTSVLITSTRAVTSRLLHASVISDEPHQRGRVLGVSPGEIVFYSLSARAQRCFIFRTLAIPEALSSAVPGVNPEVRLLLQTATRGRLRRLEELLEFLAHSRRTPSSLSDGFYLRLHGLLSGRLPGRKVLCALLDHEAPRALGA